MKVKTIREYFSSNCEQNSSYLKYITQSGGQINSMLYSGYYFIFSDGRYRASLVAKTVKNLPVMQETQVQSLDWEDPLEEAWQPTPVFLPGEFHGQRSLVGYSPWGHKKWDRTEQITLSRHERYNMCKNNHERKTFPNTGSVGDNTGVFPVFCN